MSGMTLQPPYDWRHGAICADNPDLHFPVGNTGPALRQIEAAKAVCRRCPVMEQCQQWALTTRQKDGVWGGLSEDERTSILRRAARQRLAGPPKPIKEPLTLDGVYRANTQSLDDGHTAWTGCYDAINIAKVRYTPTQLSFTLAYGRPPNGRVTTACTRPRCITGLHLADFTIRDALSRDCANCTSRTDYQRHLERGETPCDASREAHVAAGRRYRANAMASS